MSAKPPLPPMPPPTPRPPAGGPPDAPQPPLQRGGLPTPVMVLIVVCLLILTLSVLTAIAVPALVNQRERAWRQDLTVAVREAALEVEAAATMAGGDYSAVPDLLGIVDDAFATLDGGATLDRDSAATFVRPGTFSFCAEKPDLDGSLTYATEDGGLQPFSDAPCP